MGQTVLPPVAGLTYRREVFKASSTFTLPMSAQNKFDAVLVPGGGGGGRNPNMATNRITTGGCGGMLYVKDVYCTNGTTLTITVGAGGAPATFAASGTDGSSGTASSITGIAGNGISTSITSTVGPAGRGRYAPTYQTYNGPIASVVLTGLYGRLGSKYIGANTGFGFGATSKTTGHARYGNPSQFFQTKSGIYQSSVGNLTINQQSNSTGGPIPLLANYLHATAGATGTTGTSPGATSTANTFFAGAGGGGRGISSYAGIGGAGGAGGISTSAGTLSGNGGNGSANSGGGGGGAGKNNASNANQGDGGTGGSGFVIIGYWG